MNSIKALQRQRDQSRDLVAQETISASQTSNCGTVTVAADDTGTGGGGGIPDTGTGGGGDGTDPVAGGIGTTSIAIAGGIGLLGVLLLLLN